MLKRIQTKRIHAAGDSFAIVASRYNARYVDAMVRAARAELKRAGAKRVEVVRVPGAFEIPMAAQRVAETGRVAAVVCLGCLIRGATPHFEVIAQACAQGITAASAASGVPMTFGVLTTHSAEQALERAGPGPGNKGREAAEAALEMVRLYSEIGDGRP